MCSRIIWVLSKKEDFKLLTSKDMDIQSGLLKFDISVCLIILVFFVNLVSLYLNYRVKDQNR